MTRKEVARNLRNMARTAKGMLSYEGLLQELAFYANVLEKPDQRDATASDLDIEK